MAGILVVLFGAAPEIPLLERLARHLAPAERQGLLSLWDPAKIAPGAAREAEIATQLDAADLIVVLVSADLLAGHHAHLEHAARRHRAGQARAIAVLARACDWSAAGFADLPLLPPDGRPLHATNPDEALRTIAVEVRELAGALRASPALPPGMPAGPPPAAAASGAGLALSLPEQRRLGELREQLRRQDAALVLGWRAAVLAGMPPPERLAGHLAEHVGVTPDRFEETCAHVTALRGEMYLRRLLAEYLEDEHVPIGALHQFAARAPFAWYLTTGPDRLLEWALEDAERRPAPIFFDLRRALHRPARVPVVKLCGSIEHAHTVLLGASTAAARVQLSECGALLRRLPRVASVLVAGFDADDPWLLPLLAALADASGGAEIVLAGAGRPPPGSLPVDVALFTLTVPRDRLADLLALLSDLPPDERRRYERRRLLRANPFPGLTPYRRRAPDFHGRSQEAEQLYARLSDLPLVSTWFGPSGCGKTSLLQAGLLPLVEDRGEHRALLTRLPIGVEPTRHLAVELCQAAGAALPPAAASLDEVLGAMTAIVQRSERPWLVIIDQFEQLFYPPFTRAERDVLLTEHLPALARSGQGRLRFVLLLRSDDLHWLHGYESVPCLGGIFRDSSRIRSLSTEVARDVVAMLFATRQYALSRECLDALVRQSTSSPTAVEGEPPYLPYLQLLGSRFFDWLEAQHGRTRGYSAEIPVAVREFDEFLAGGALFSDYLHETVLELLQLEQDRALVFRLLDLMVEGERRRPMTLARLERHFADRDRARALLLNLISRRLVQFDEASAAYELVHDALVAPLRSYLDEQRTDYGRADLCAIAERLLLGREPLRPALAGNLALHLLRSQLPSDWLEGLLEDPVEFYVGLLGRCLPEDRPAVLVRLAAVGTARGRAPRRHGAGEWIDLALCTELEKVAAAALTLVRTSDPAAADVARLRAWIDPDEETAGPRSPQSRGWLDVFAAALDLVGAAPGADLTSLFMGPRTALLSEGAWWKIYFGRLLGVLRDGRDAEAIHDRIRRAVLEAEEDPELLQGLAAALEELDELPAGFEEPCQRVMAALRRRPGPTTDASLVRLCELLLERQPKGVFLRLEAALSDLSRTGLALRAARTLGLAAQEPEDLVDLGRRFDAVIEPEHRAFLFEALVGSPAEPAGAVAYLADASDELRQALSLIDGERMRALGACLEGDDWLACARAELAAMPAHLRHLALYLVAREYRHGAAESLGRLLQLLRLCCACVAEQALQLAPAQLAERLDPSPAGHASFWHFLRWWDLAHRVISGLAKGLVEAGEHLQAALRWVRLQLRPLVHGDATVAQLVAQLDRWFAVHSDISRSLTRPSAPCYRAVVSQSAAYAELRALLAAPPVRAVLAGKHFLAGARLYDGAQLDEVLAGFERLDRAGAVVHHAALPAEILRWLVECLQQERWAPGREVLRALLRSGWPRAPGWTDAERVAAVAQALVVAYAGEWPTLVEHAAVIAPDVETRVELLSLLTSFVPASAAAALCALAEEAHHDPGLAGPAESALAGIAACPMLPELAPGLRRIVDETTSDLVRFTALMALRHHSTAVEDVLRCLDLAHRDARLRHALMTAKI